MEQTVLEHGWDGEWFLRAYDFFGKKIGSSECEDGQILIESQGYCVMAGIGVASGHAKKALDSVRDRLETAHGIVLNQPAYKAYHVELGEISSYPPGYKENAGIFCHNNPWIMIAETVIGRGERAFALWKKIAPAYREEISEVHRLEPYVYAQMIAGKDAVRHGEAKNSWLTGTAAWNFVAISQHILGVKPELDGLRVNPCIGPEVSALHRRPEVPGGGVPDPGQEHGDREGRAARRGRKAAGRHARALRPGGRRRDDRLRGLIARPAPGRGV